MEFFLIHFTKKNITCELLYIFVFFTSIVLKHDTKTITDFMYFQHYSSKSLLYLKIKLKILSRCYF